jgi:hypothetical protein
MTAFFDYILPMILHRMGILKYRADLEAKILSRTLIGAGTRQEEEIRAATGAATDRLRHALTAYEGYRDVNILGIDAILWIQCGEVPIPPFLLMPPEVYVRGEEPHHRTITTNY